jgi:hypothetical protein
MTEDHPSSPGRMTFLRYNVGAEIGGEDGERLRELEAAAEEGDRLRPEEMAEMRRIYEAHGTGVFLEGPEWTKLGVKDPKRFRENFWGIQQQADYAYENQFAFEAISCRMLILDFMLRAYIVYKTDKSIEPYSKRDRMSFGKLIEKAKNVGLPEELANDLWAFNEKRNGGIHHFLLGEASYQDVADAYVDAKGLFERIADAMSLPPMEER